MTRILLLITFNLSVVTKAEDSLWTDNKLTPAQPFRGSVLAVETSWVGYRLVIESMGEGDKTYCIAQVWPGHSRLTYEVVDKESLPKPSVTTVHLNPAVEINRFSWSMGPWKIGSIFGDDDSLKKVVDAARISENQKAKPSHTGKPAAIPKPDSKGTDKPQPKAEAPSQ